MGGYAVDQYGVSLPEQSLEVCPASDSILLGAVGGPESVNKDKLHNQLLAAAVAFILLNALASALGLLNVFG